MDSEVHKESNQSNGPDLAAEGIQAAPASSPQVASDVQTYFMVERTEEGEEVNTDRLFPGTTSVSVPPPPNGETVTTTVASSTNAESSGVRPTFDTLHSNEEREEQRMDDVKVTEEGESPPTSPLERSNLMIVEVEPMEVNTKEPTEEKRLEDMGREPSTTTLLDTAKEDLEKTDEVSSDSEVGGEDVEIIVEGEENSDEEDTDTADTSAEPVQADKEQHGTSSHGGEGEGDSASNALRAKQSARVKQFFTTLQKFGNNMSRDGAEQVQELISALLVNITGEGACTDRQTDRQTNINHMHNTL